MIDQFDYVALPLQIIRWCWI